MKMNRRPKIVDFPLTKSKFSEKSANGYPFFPFPRSRLKNVTQESFWESGEGGGDRGVHQKTRHCKTVKKPMVFHHFAKSIKNQNVTVHFYMCSINFKIFKNVVATPVLTSL